MKKLLDLVKYPYPIGTKVDLNGTVGTVTATPGPYSVTIDNRITASITIVKPVKITRHK